VKIAFLTDSHWGFRSQLPIGKLYLKHFSEFHREVFFPYLKKHNILHVFHGGDLVHHRKMVTFETAKIMREVYVEPSIEAGIHTTLICGNHDSFYKSTLDVNALWELLPVSHFQSHVVPEEVEMGGVTFLLLPWICKSNEKESMEAIRESDADVVYGHLELMGFEEYRGREAPHGMDSKLFARFDEVYSGHYHHPSCKGNIRYLGAPYQMTWNDFDCPRGFHVYDTDTRVMEFIRNPVDIFHRVEYDDSDKTTKQLLKEDFSKYKDKIVRLIVNKRENKKGFAEYVNNIEGGAADFQVVDNVPSEKAVATQVSEEVNSASTLDIILKCVEESDSSNKADLSKLMKELHDKALHSEV
jgi:DNA repair exonuclease SbcCD nuclease subunit